MNAPCGCCEGTEALTPMTTANRPGLPALSYRVGTHATFLETMKARLSSADFPELTGLKTRAPDDPAIALMDSWALVAGVLTFYQERIANEGYLRTATERRSILELARLIGYTLRPGVASTVYLAYTLDEDRSVTPPKPTAVTIPAGARAQSVPGPGEQMQSFETSDKLEARSTWNELKPRLTQPQTEGSIRAGKDQASPTPRVYLKGVVTNLKQNDPLLIDFGTGNPGLFRVIDVKPDAAADRTCVSLTEWQSAGLKGPAAATAPASTSVIRTEALLKQLLAQPSVPPFSSARLQRDVRSAFTEKADTSLQLLSGFQPALSGTLPTALANVKVTEKSAIKVYAFRVKAAPFGNNAPKRTRVERGNGEVTVIGEWPVIEWRIVDEKGHANSIDHETGGVMYLDASYDKIMSDTSSNRSWVVVDFSAWTREATANLQVKPVTQETLITNVKDVNADVSRADYGITGKTTRIKLTTPWLTIAKLDPSRNIDPNTLQAVYDADFQVIRSSTVYAQSEELPLADEPIDDPICGGKSKPIELNSVYSGLQSGRWLIVSGERTDIKNEEGVVVPGVKASELVMLADIQQRYNEKLPGDTTHTYLQLAGDGLAYCYKRDTVTIYGNVVKATHGETRNEVMGGGDAAKALQPFVLKQPPLTFVSAANPSGVDSTLQVRVNDVLWHETDSLAGLLPADRKFITRTDDEGKTTTIFGNGQQGARLPTGQENVKAVYRNGIGKPGNVKAEQISLLGTRPLGVKSVTNPLRASGGADKENRDQARQNAPLAVMALDRLVSTQDYADFARTFAGIGKASAARLSDGRRELVHVTIAGADDIPIEKSSDLYRNLVEALRDCGDPYLPIQVDVRELLALVISANVRVLPDYQWESVELKIRAALLDEFSFQRRGLGQTVFLSEIVSAIQRVAGVAYVDVDLLSSISEVELSTPDLLTQKLAALAATTKPEPYVTVHLAETVAQGERDRQSSTAVDGIYPAQLAFLTADVPDTLILKEVTR